MSESVKNREGRKKKRDVWEIQKVSQESTKFTASFQTALKPIFCEGGNQRKNGMMDGGSRHGKDV